jgi:hypothetical protein
MTRPVDPEPKRCGVCGTRLSRTEVGHEDVCFRRSFGWAPVAGQDGADTATGAPTAAAIPAMEAAHGR